MREFKGITKRKKVVFTSVGIMVVLVLVSIISLQKSKAEETPTKPNVEETNQDQENTSVHDYQQNDSAQEDEEKKVVEQTDEPFEVQDSEDEVKTDSEDEVKTGAEDKENATEETDKADKVDKADKAETTTTKPQANKTETTTTKPQVTKPTTTTKPQVTKPTPTPTTKPEVVTPTVKPEVEKPVHTCTYVPKYKIVNIPAEGHYDTVVVKEAWTENKPIIENRWACWCHGCGKDITADPAAHIKSQMLAGNMECSSWCEESREVQIGTEQIEHAAVTEEKWVETSPACTEEQLIGHQCLDCGKWK